MARDGGDDRALVIARGRFDEARIEGLVREQGGTVENDRGTRLMTVTGAHSTTVAFPEAGLALIGTTVAVRRAMDTKAGDMAAITANREVMDLVRDMDDANAWAVGRFDAMTRRGRVPSALAGHLPPLGWFSASGRVNRGVEGVLRAEANSDEAAADLREVVRGFVALARLQVSRNPELSTLLDSLQLGGEGRTVSVGFTLPAEVVDAFVAMRRGPSTGTP
jgi:hypothetical protein